jgi:hypothetical protein
MHFQVKSVYVHISTSRITLTQKAPTAFLQLETCSPPPPWKKYVTSANKWLPEVQHNTKTYSRTQIPDRRQNAFSAPENSAQDTNQRGTKAKPIIKTYYARHRNIPGIFPKLEERERRLSAGEGL